MCHTPKGVGLYHTARPKGPARDPLKVGRQDRYTIPGDLHKGSTGQDGPAPAAAEDPHPALSRGRHSPQQQKSQPNADFRSQIPRLGTSSYLTSWSSKLVTELVLAL